MVTVFMSLLEVEEDVTEGGSFRLFFAEVAIWILFVVGTLVYYAYQGFFVDSSQQLASAHRVLGIGGLYFFGLLPAFVGYQRFVHWTWVGVRVVTPPAQLLILSAGPTWLLAREFMSVPEFAVGVGYLPLFAGLYVMKREGEATSPETVEESISGIQN